MVISRNVILFYFRVHSTIFVIRYFTHIQISDGINNKNAKLLDEFVFKNIENYISQSG